MGEDREQSERYEEDEEDAASLASRRLCNAVAAAVVLRQELAPEAAAALAALPGAPRAVALALVADRNCGLQHLQLLESGAVAWQPAAAPKVLPCGTAAWRVFYGQQPLVWRRTQDSASTEYTDWQRVLKADPPVDALLTVPLIVPGWPAALGSVTYALTTEPSARDTSTLLELAHGMAASIAHHTKQLWEESLGFFNQVIPGRVVQRMMSAALSLEYKSGNSAGPPAAPRQQPALVPVSAVAAATALLAGVPDPPELPMSRQVSLLSEGPFQEQQPIVGQGAPEPINPFSKPHISPVKPSNGQPAESALTNHASASSPEKPGKLSEHPVPAPAQRSPTSQAQAVAEQVATAALAQRERALFDSCMSVGTVDDEPAGLPDGIKTLRQKWNLEFADPVLEESFKLWFNAQQTRTDLEVMRYLGVLMAALVAGLAVRGHVGWGDVLAVLHGLLSVAVLAGFMQWNTPWYILHRSTVVATVRVCSAAVLLLHVYLDPGFYSGGFVKSLAGSCAPTLVVNCFRNRLRFSNHLLVQLAKLYLCAMCNAFVHASHTRAAETYLSLPATSAVQLLSALIPSLVVYRLESGVRREFLYARLAASPSPRRLAATACSAPAALPPTKCA